MGNCYGKHKKLIYECKDTSIIKKEIIHWVWNDGKDPVSILLMGTQDVHSPLSLLQGLESIVLKNVMDLTMLPLLP